MMARQSNRSNSLSFLFLLVVGLVATVYASRAAVVISEFMTENNGLLRDADGNSPDWLEIHNTSSNAINLTGWHLTDSAAIPTKWTFPETYLAGGGYLVVFASGKDRAIAGSELHTNFQLDNDGEYLALVQPNGTISHAYAPKYPPQRANVSYGLQTSNAPPFRLDFNSRVSGEIGPADTEVGFNTMTLNANPSTFNGITVTLSAIGSVGLDDRDRAVPVQTATLTEDQIYDDFIFINSSVAGNGMQIRVTGLRPSQYYRVKLWSVDVGGSTQGNRLADWIETASGTTNVIQLGYTWNVSQPPTKDGDNTFSATVLSSSNGVLQIEGRHSGGASSSVYVNGLELLEEESVFPSSNELRYFQPATPGAPNGTGFSGIVAEPAFSVERGFYDAPFAVVLTNGTPGAEIRWTTNGSVPTQTNGAIYTAPIQIGNTTLLRAAAFLDDHISSDPVTHTYIFLNQVLQQPARPTNYPVIWQGNYPGDYAMDPNVVNHPAYGATISNDLRSIPTLSIVSSHYDFWDGVNGIYNHATSEGPQWERAASIELIETDGSTGFAVNCGVQMQGNASRDNARTPKHSMRLLFKSRYGPSKLRHNWFPGRVDEFNTLVLRACFTDSWSTRYSDTTLIPGGMGTRYRPEDSLLLRDVWVKDCMRDMGWLSGRSSFVHLYINGLYWGVYNPAERLDAGYFSSHLGGRQEDWDVIRDFSEVLDGSKAEWNQMMALVNAGITNEAAYQAVHELVDVENLIDYMLLHIYAEAEDWPHHNWYAARRKANPTNGLPATKWIFLAWDQEIVLDQLVRRNRINVNHNDTPARIYSQLRAWPEFRRLFGDRIQKHLFNGGALTASNNIARMQSRVEQIDRAIVGESARWGDAREYTIGTNPGHGQTFTRDEWWIPELDKLYTNFFQTLNDINIDRFRAGNLYPLVGAPIFNQHGGTVSGGFAMALSHTNAGGTIYFTLDGTDPRQYGSGTVAPGAQAYDSPIQINEVTFVRARVLRGLLWSALVETVFYPPQDLSKLCLTELMYNPPPFAPYTGNDLEFLELKNVGANTLNLSGLTFSGITFTFTNGTELAPGSFFVLVRNATAFAAKYPGVPFHGVYSGQLDNGGESITLLHSLGGNVFSVTYDDAAPWPVAPDGFGFSLVPKNPGLTQTSDKGANWRASAHPGGSPGADDPEPNIPAIVITEILTHTDLPQRDAIELHNPTSTDADISGWYLTDNAGIPRKFRIPDGTILPAGGYLALDDSQFNTGANGNIAFAFNSVGEEVYLFSANPDTQLTGYTHGFIFGPAFNGVSFGRHLNSVGEEFFPLQNSVTLGQMNSGPRIGPIILNEIHYHPPTGGDEFLELLNISSNTVSFFDSSVPTNTWKVNGIAYSFPSNVTLGPGELLLLVPIDPSAFRQKYDVPAAVQILGPYTGILQNDGERLALEAPDSPNPTLVPYVAVEEVRYNDKAPWPAAADGGGFSLQRLSLQVFANEPTNWTAAIPTPGRLFDSADSDGDGIPDFWEILHGLNPHLNDANENSDEDGATNLEEFQNGTDPRSFQNFFRLGVAEDAAAGMITLDFYTLAGRNYTIQQSSDLSTGIWTDAFTIGATNAAPIHVTSETSSEANYYRLKID